MLLIVSGLIDIPTRNIDEEHLFFLAGYLRVVIAFLDFILVLKLLITHRAQKLVIVGVLLDHLLIKSNTLWVVPFTFAFALHVELVIVFALTNAVGVLHITSAYDGQLSVGSHTWRNICWLNNLTSTVSLARCR